MAVLAELPTLQRILENLLIVLPFAVIVLFQQEIRRALASFGRNPLWGLAKQQKAVASFSEIVLAATTLSARRTGALIVIERLQGLRNYIENGIALDAQTSYDLLINIFQPDTPLHDGAVIVQDDRIAAAACFLPLTPNPELSKEFGTRHRAALGITEETDAVAVVVSEETGIISVAFDGELTATWTARPAQRPLQVPAHRPLPPGGDARERERPHLGAAPARPRHRHRHLVQRLAGGPPGLQREGGRGQHQLQPPPGLHHHQSGAERERAAERQQEGDPPAQPLHGGRAGRAVAAPGGTATINLGPSNVTAPDGMEVVSIEPPHDPGGPRARGHPAPAGGAEAHRRARRPGPSSRSPRSSPTRCWSPARSPLLARRRHLSTEPISLDGRAATFEETVPVVSPDPLIQIVQPSKVTVRVPLQPPATERTPGRGETPKGQES